MHVTTRSFNKDNLAHSHKICRRAKTALIEGNLANLEKLVRKGKTTPEVVEDRILKV